MGTEEYVHNVYVAVCGFEVEGGEPDEPTIGRGIVVFVEVTPIETFGICNGGNVGKEGTNECLPGCIHIITWIENLT